MSTQILGKYLLTGRIQVITGLHIGGSTVGLEIGGLDNPVIKDPLTDAPYIPGSSLKGKLRALTEWQLGLIKEHPKHKGYQAYACEELMQPETTSSSKQWRSALALARIYGAASDENKVRMTAGPVRLTVRDAFLDEASKKRLERALGKGSYTEVKTENALDRVTSEAMPRPIERVPAGSGFDFSMIFDRYEAEDHQLLKTLFAAMTMLEHSTLGGGGSRGNGQIAFVKIGMVWRSTEDYRSGQSGSAVKLPGATADEILNGFDNIQWL